MKIYLLQGELLMQFPVNPKELKVTESSKNRVQTVLNIGDVNIPDVRSLHEISFKSHFPKYWRGYCAVSKSELKQPWDYVKNVIDFKSSKTPVRLVLGGNMQNILKANNNSSSLFLVESMEYDIRAGEEEDIYFEIKLKQYRNFEPRTVTLTMPNVNGSKPTVTPTNPPRENNTNVTTQRKYTVQSGDSLWVIARKYYGDGSLYMKIAKANNISNPSLIYPNQVLVIP